MARRHNVSRQAVSERVKRLANQHADFAVRRDVRGRIVAVPVAQYEELVGLYGDAAKRPLTVREPEPGPEPRGHDNSLDQARLLAAQVSAERAAIALAREKQELVRRDGIEAALEEAGVSIGAVIDRLPRHAEDLAAALSRDGVQGLRVVLKGIARDLRREIADHLEALHDNAPVEEPAELAEEETV